MRYLLTMHHNDPNLLRLITVEIQQASAAWKEQELSEETLPSASDLSRLFGIRLEVVKKKLRLLKQANLIHPMSFSPKRYRFDDYQFQHLSETDPLWEVLHGIPDESVSPY